MAGPREETGCITCCQSAQPGTAADLRRRSDLRPNGATGRVRAPGADSPPYGGFLWGYTGGSPAQAAEALLTDALALPTLDTLDKTGPTMGHDTLSVRLRNDFTFDVMSQLGDEWRLRRGAVLRWVRGWYVEHDLDRPPRIVLSPPAISPYE